MTDETTSRIRKFYNYLKESVTAYSDDNANDKAAGLAFYGAFSIAPLLLIATAIAGFVFGQRAAEEEMATQLETAVGAEPAAMVEDMVAQASNIGAGVAATIIGAAALIWTGTKVFLALQRSLDDIWDVDEDDSGWRQSVRDKARSASLVLGAGLLLIASLLASVVLTAFARFAADIVPAPPFVWELLNLGVIFVLLTGVFAVLFRYLPRVQPPWRHVWLGAAVTSALFVLGRWAFGLYVTEATPASIFGAAGALAIFLLWIYYMAQIFFFGAEFTKVYARHNQGADVLPAQ